MKEVKAKMNRIVTLLIVAFLVLLGVTKVCWSYSYGRPVVVRAISSSGVKTSKSRNDYEKRMEAQSRMVRRLRHELDGMRNRRLGEEDCKKIISRRLGGQEVNFSNGFFVINRKLGINFQLRNGNTVISYWNLKEK